MLRKMAHALRPLVDRQPALGRLFRRARERRRWRMPDVTTPFGFRFAGNDGMARGMFEPEETALIAHLLGRCDAFVNVGANIGFYCCQALHRNRPVLAVEPLPGNLRYLYRNVFANGWERRIEVFPVALAAQPGVVRMFGEDTGASLIAGWAGNPAHTSTVVPATTLDHVLANRFLEQQILILADVEGAEFDMLAGAAETLGRARAPLWIVEIATSEHMPTGINFNPRFAETFRVFWQHGYHAFTADRQLSPVTTDDVAAIERNRRNVFGTQNFVFAAPAAIDLLRARTT